MERLTPQLDAALSPVFNHTLHTCLLITAGAHCEVLNDLQVRLYVQQVGCALTATQLQHRLQQTLVLCYRHVTYF